MSDVGGDRGALETGLGLARVAAGVWLRTAAWSLGASVRMARAASAPEEARELFHEAQDGVRGYVREVLGVAEMDERIRQLMPARAAEPEAAAGNGSASDVEALRALGAELLRRSADVGVDQSGHPAYARILEQLAPDEARVLRLLWREGSQPAVDVRSMQLIGLGAQPVAEGLTMIGRQAGCLRPERVAAYLDNLHRLGLIWFSKEPVEDPLAYQVLEAQPEVLKAIKSAPRSKTVQRSIRLTPFGKDFCETCLPSDTAEIEALDPPS